MPELAEVETIRRDLEGEILGRTVVQAVATNARCIRRHPDPAEFASRIEGRTVTAVDRRGKYLLVRLGDESLVIHLGMSGQLLWAPAGDPAAADARPKHTHVVLTFDVGAELRYVDPRTFGELFLATDPDDPLPNLGPDALGGVRTWQRLHDLLRAKTTKLKPLLMDQRFLAGIGNMYADEILWAAGLRYDRPANTLTAEEAQRLHAAIGKTLKAAVKHRGSSFADEQYRDLYGRIGQFQRKHNVYAREGAPCPRCHQPVVRLKWQNRSTFLCPACQR